MHLLLVPVHLHLSGEAINALLVLADERMLLSVGVLLLLPLNWMLLGLVIVHQPWSDATPPDVELVLAQLALPTPLLGEDLSDVDLDLALPTECRTATLPPGAGVTDEGVHSIDMDLPITSLTKILVAVFTIEGFYLLVHCLDVPLQNRTIAETQTTLVTLVWFLLQMNRLEMLGHISLQIKPLPTLWALVDHTFMD